MYVMTAAAYLYQGCAMGRHKKITLAICGLGGFARRRILPALISSPDIELVAVVDRAMTDFELPSNIRRFNSLEELLNSDLADSVYISTPNHLHSQQAQQCLQAGRHVLCEKPMATNSQDCQSMLFAAKKSALQLTIGHMLRYSPALQEAKKLLENGMIGVPRSIKAIFYYDLPESKRPWAFRKEHSGGGALMDAGIHCIDTIRFLINGPVNVLEARTDSVGVSGIDRIAQCRLTVGGVMCSLSVCSNAPYSSELLICGDEAEIAVSSFAACWDTVNVKYSSYENRGLNKEVMFDVSETYAYQLQAFADAIKSQDVNYRSAVDSLENVKIVERLYEINKPF